MKLTPPLSFGSPSSFHPTIKISKSKNTVFSFIFRTKNTHNDRTIESLDSREKRAKSHNYIIFYKNRIPFIRKINNRAVSRFVPADEQRTNFAISHGDSNEKRGEGGLFEGRKRRNAKQRLTGGKTGRGGGRCRNGVEGGWRKVERLVRAWRIASRNSGGGEGEQSEIIIFDSDAV